MTIYDVVKKIIGPIDAVGDHYVDEQRYKNLEMTIELVGSLFSDISNVAQYSDRHEASMKKIGKKASEFINELIIAQFEARRTET